ncbi:DNA polymerase III subunit gamma/tau [Parashewanella spongiae]|uniref:DNA polymerase III subunit gamma/tau n=1 Tax=Parashewanella spongiae TaxID=342950 RepID=A0A3A6TGP5_9GAMM|nr:DNA polymerase III subunit gamma/tau [Parashewanella spongiae]MCL1079169.1 DNA polymerase III subunit gamma/tau [Parashewanella spongiae]RJY11041.1 DNA polymerase III subunit gamma/tau [Parashewanella spongiae]
MSYQVLARKWRPATFEQVVGQSHVLHALTNALTQQRLHHAYLFTGTRGVGKTSLARLFAKGLNCEKGITATPCGTCSSCVEIAQGRFVDLIEVDAASRTKVDDTREILDNVQYRPTRGRYKVYLIDEVHMLSRSSFNALLKTLEEPPEHVKFLLATTDPQKLPVTVLSRCLQFNLKSLTQEDIAKQLDFVLEQEQMKFESQALTLLAKSANGSMRDALSLTDQAIAFGAGEVMLNQVQTMLGSIDEHHVIGLFSALTTGNVAELMPACTKVIEFGAEPEEVLRSLLELLHQITLTQFAPAAAQLSLYADQIKAFAEQLSPEQVQLYYQILVSGRKDLAYAPDPKSGLEMALLRAIAFVPETPITKWKKSENPQQSVASVLVTPQVETKAVDVVVEANTNVEVEDPAVKKALSQSSEITKVTTETVSTEVDKENDVSALEAEQAVLLSQAQSQGFNDIPPPDFDVPEAVNLDLQSTESPEPINYEVSNSTEQNNRAPQAIADTVVSATQTVDIDPLEAVLASRDALLSDLSAEEKDKEGGAKKPKSVAERKPFARRDDAKQTDSNSAPLGVSDNHDSAELADQVVETPPWEVSSTPVEQKIETSNVTDENEVAQSVQSTSIPVKSEQLSVDIVQSQESLTPSAPSSLTGDATDLYWYKLMSELDCGGRIRQLAVNSVCREFSEPLPLLLKPDQKHLSADIAIKQLEAALSKNFDKPITVNIEFGLDKHRETPLEVRQRFQKELLQDTELKLRNDPSIQWLMDNMGASLNMDTVAFPPANLSLKGQAIKNLEFVST